MVLEVVLFCYLCCFVVMVLEVVLFCYSCYFAIRYSYGLRTEVVLFCYLCYFVVSVRRYASLLLVLINAILLFLS